MNTIIKLDQSGFKNLNNSNVIRTMLSITSYNELSKYIVDMAVSTSFILKELNRCSLDKKLLLSKLQDIIVEVYKENFSIEQLKNIFISKKSHHDAINALIIISSPIVDLYTIARMFKKFKKTNYFPPKQKYIIYYAGNLHSVVIREFLSSLDFTFNFNKESDIDKSPRCLYMSGLKIDFI